MQEKKQDRIKQLPFASLSLILALVMAAFLANENRLKFSDSAFKHYLESGLQAMEAPLYREYLSRENRLELDGSADAPETVNTSEYAQYLAQSAMLDRSFAHYLEQHSRLLFSSQQTQTWKQKRQHLQSTHLNHLPAYEFGLMPNKAEARHFVSYIIAETNLINLALNLLLIGLLAPVIERLFGRTALLTWVISSGAINALLYYLYASAEQAILTGAGGITSGLCGVLIAIIALKPAAFFPSSKTRLLLCLSVAALFGLQAGATVWLGSSKLNLLAAELGTMTICAAACVLLFSAQISRNVTNSKLEKALEKKDPQGPEFRLRLHEALNEICQFNFDRAASLLRTLTHEYPEDLSIAKHSYHLAKLGHDANELKSALSRYINLICIHNDYQSAKQLLPELVQETRDHTLLETDSLSQLFRLFLEHNDLRKAELCYRVLQSQSSSQALLNECAALLRTEFEKHQLYSKVEQYSH